jgi:hypothetical protein
LLRHTREACPYETHRHGRTGRKLREGKRSVNEIHLADGISVTHRMRDHWVAPQKVAVPPTRARFLAVLDDTALLRESGKSQQAIGRVGRWCGVRVHLQPSTRPADLVRRERPLEFPLV